MSQRTLSIATLDYPDYRDCGKESEQKDPVSRLIKVVGNAQLEKGGGLRLSRSPPFSKGAGHPDQLDSGGGLRLSRSPPLSKGELVGVLPPR